MTRAIAIGTSVPVDAAASADVLAVCIADIGDHQFHVEFCQVPVALLPGGMYVVPVWKKFLQPVLLRSGTAYEYATLDECHRATGKAPIGTRWIDINNGDAAKTNYRSHLVAKEYKVDVRPDLFAATPPTECPRL